MMDTVSEAAPSAFYDIFRNATGDTCAIGPAEADVRAQCRALDARIVAEDAHTIVARVPVIASSTAYVVRPPPPSASFGRIVLSTLLKDESARRVCTWIAHHLALGVDHVLLYDNASAPSNRAALERAVDAMRAAASRVTIIDWPFAYVREASGMSAQTTQQNHSLYWLRHSSVQWLALLDVDEFLVPMGAFRSLRDVLATMAPDVAALSVQCMWFGCGRGAAIAAAGNDDDDDDDFLERLRWRAKRACGRRQRCKLLVRPALADMVVVHEATRVRGRIVHADAGRLLRFNHYYTLSAKRRPCRCHYHCAVEEVTRVLTMPSSGQHAMRPSSSSASAL